MPALTQLIPDPGVAPVLVLLCRVPAAPRDFTGTILIGAIEPAL